MRARWAVVVGLLLGVLGVSVAVPPALADTSSAASSAPATAPVPLGQDYLTDEAGVLSARERTELEQRLTALSKAKDLQLFVVFVDRFTDPENRQQWTEQVAKDNDLGDRQYLLAIATDGRSYYLSASEDGPIPLSQVDRISASLVNDLHDSDWAGAVRTAAAGFEGGSGGPDLVGIVLVIACILAIVVAIVVLIAMRRRAAARIRPVSTEPVADPLDAISDDELETRAGSALVRTDDAVTSSTEDLGFATAQFGDASTAVFTDVVAKAKAKLDEAFSLKQRLDDEIPDTDAQRREWYLRIIRLCEAADTALNANVAAFDELRALEKDAEQALAHLEQHRAAATSVVAGAPAALLTLQGSYDASALSTPARSPAQASSRLATADAGSAGARRLRPVG